LGTENEFWNTHSEFFPNAFMATTIGIDSWISKAPSESSSKRKREGYGMA